MDGMRDETGSGLGDSSDLEKLTNGETGEWTSAMEMEMEMMLGEMIAMAGLAQSVEVPYASESFGVDPDMSTLGNWDMDSTIGGIGAH